MTSQPKQEAGQPQASEDGLVVSYKTRSGRRREALIAVDTNGVWVVYDIPAGNTTVKSGLLVDRLLGDQEKLDKAHALAVDYAACQTAFAQGRREEHPNPDPLPKPTRVPIRTIRRHAARAAGAPALEREAQLRAHPAR